MGFGVGPLFWAPLSEIFGRKPAVLIPYFLAAVFSFGTAAAKDIQTIVITRFFAGFFGSAPVTNTGGVLGDVWSPTERGTAIVFYAFAVVGGPVLGPIVGGAIVQSYLRWRWTEYVRNAFILELKMDSWHVAHGYHDDVHPHLRHPRTRGKLPTKTLGLQSKDPTYQNGKLGATCRI